MEAIDLNEPGTADEWVSTTVTIGEHTYALRIDGDSMAPTFPPGSIIVVEPDMEPQPGSYVIAKNGDDATFKQLVKDAGRWYLKPMNSQYPTIEMGNEYRVIGVVRQQVQTYC